MCPAREPYSVQGTCSIHEESRAIFHMFASIKEYLHLLLQQEQNWATSLMQKAIYKA